MEDEAEEEMNSKWGRNETFFFSVLFSHFPKNTIYFGVGRDKKKKFKCWPEKMNILISWCVFIYFFMKIFHITKTQYYIIYNIMGYSEIFTRIASLIKLLKNKSSKYFHYLMRLKIWIYSFLNTKSNMTTNYNLYMVPVFYKVLKKT